MMTFRMVVTNVFLVGGQIATSWQFFCQNNQNFERMLFFFFGGDFIYF